MKASSIYKTQDKFIVITSSESDIGLYLDDDPICTLPINCEIEKLQEAIFYSLKKSRKNIPTPKRDEWAKWKKEQLKKIDQKSYTGLYKNSNSCSIREENGIVKIWPHKFLTAGKPSDGLDIVEEDVVEIKDAEFNKSEVVSKVMGLLQKKYK